MVGTAEEWRDSLLPLFTPIYCVSLEPARANHANRLPGVFPGKRKMRDNVHVAH